MSRVYCIGVWDLLHEGHRIILRKASKMGELWVGVVCDEAVKKQKGENRPIVNEDDRLKAVQELRYVYHAILINDFEITDMARFDLIVVGEDQTHLKNLDKIANHQKVIIPRMDDGYSTSNILKRMQNGT